jgi:dTDP-4-dehydrorhamnose reductase
MSGVFLCLGRSGQVATALAQAATRREIDLVCFGRGDVNLSERGAVADLIARLNPSVVFNAAAYTQVDKAETEEQAAYDLNATMPGEAANAAATIGAKFLHLSTDYVFAGDKTGPYLENDPTGPMGAYGRTKLAGELAVLAANPKAFVLRTAWVYSATGSNFVKTMLRLAATRPELGVVGDQRGCPTFADDIAEAMFNLAASQGPGGLFHLTASGNATWAEFATAIFEQSAKLGGPTASVKAITSADYPTPAKRPANSELSGEKLRQTHDISLPEWRDGLQRCLEQIKESAWRVS